MVSMSEIVADTRGQAQMELDRLREDYQQRLPGMAEGKTLARLVPLYLDYQRAKEHGIGTIEARIKSLEARDDQYKLARRAVYRRRRAVATGKASGARNVSSGSVTALSIEKSVSSITCCTSLIVSSRCCDTGRSSSAWRKTAAATGN